MRALIVSSSASIVSKSWHACSPIAIDLLSPLFTRFTLSARVFYTVALCGIADFDNKQAWTLETLAQAAGTSRARFAAGFKCAVGKPPLDYLTDWRISVAQTLLRSGKPLNAAPPLVGYASAAALSRVLAKRVKASPIQ